MDVRVNDDAIVSLEPAAQEDVRSFARDSREREQLVHFRGDFAAEVGDDFLRSANDRF